MELYCRIVRREWPCGFESPNFFYEVREGDGTVVATGVSSSEHWVRHDAGGYHTKEIFDARYPDGWNIHFQF